MSYSVRWPVSLVLSKRSLTKYQMLFRHLFFAKHVQRLLFKSWRDHQVGSPSQERLRSPTIIFELLVASRVSSIPVIARAQGNLGTKRFSRLLDVCDLITGPSINPPRGDI